MYIFQTDALEQPHLSPLSCLNSVNLSISVTVIKFLNSREKGDSSLILKHCDCTIVPLILVSGLSTKLMLPWCQFDNVVFYFQCFVFICFYVFWDGNNHNSTWTKAKLLLCIGGVSCYKLVESSDPAATKNLRVQARE